LTGKHKRSADGETWRSKIKRRIRIRMRMRMRIRNRMRIEPHA